MKNSYYFHQNLLHRIDTLLTLSQDFSKHAYLLPELLIKTLKDSHRLLNNGISHLNGIEIVDVLNISCSSQEKDLLTNIEHSLRKAIDYQTLSQEYDKDILLAITLKIQNYLLQYSFTKEKEL